MQQENTTVLDSPFPSLSLHAEAFSNATVYSFVNPKGLGFRLNGPQIASTLQTSAPALETHSLNKLGWREFLCACFSQGKEGMVNKRKNTKMNIIYRVKYIFIYLKGFYCQLIPPPLLSIYYVQDSL